MVRALSQRFHVFPFSPFFSLLLSTYKENPCAIYDLANLIHFVILTNPLDSMEVRGNSVFSV